MSDRGELAPGCGGLNGFTLEKLQGIFLVSLPLFSFVNRLFKPERSRKKLDLIGSFFLMYSVLLKCKSFLTADPCI